MKKNPSRKSQRGVAYLVVLFAMVMAASILAVSVPSAESIFAISKVNNDRILNVYVCESLFARAQWMLINDVFTYSDRNTMSQYFSEDAAQQMEEKIAETGEDRVMADGSEYEIAWLDQDIYCGSYKIDDAVSDFNFNGETYTIQQRMNTYFKAYTDSEEAEENMKYMKDQLFDYIDNNDQTRDYGAEEDFYAREGLPKLPRNKRIQTVEELFWVPGVRDWFLKVDNEGLPSNMRNGLSEHLFEKFGSLESNKNASFQSSSGDYISNMLTGRFTDEDQRNRFYDAYNAYKTEGTAFYNSLEANEIASLRSGFSTTESGFYMITVESKSKTNPARRKMKICFPLISRYTTQNYSIMSHYYYYIIY